MSGEDTEREPAEGSSSPSLEQWLRLTQSGGKPPRFVQFTPPKTIDELREETRSWIAKALVLLLIGATVAMVALIAAESIKVNEALAVLGALTAVVGTALGFYFGGHKT
ncbi:MAG TPA: hypothetical protein VMG62_03030 [Solirubrobacteraceae bacterium]|nr:hypothetical protein [Solirubrobacteraceae bacterium]